MVYSNGNFVYAIGGIPVGSGSATPPPPPPPQSSEKTLWLATDNAAGVISGSAYINGTGSPVAVWSSTGSSASASVTLWPGDTVVVVTETNRPVGYSSTIYSTGYTTSAPWFTTAQTVVVSGTATYEGADSAIMSAKYSAGQMVVTASGMFFDIYSGLSPIADEIDFSGPLRLTNDVSASPESAIAYKYDNTATSWNQEYSAYQYNMVPSAFSAYRVSATAYARITAVGDHAVSYFRLFQTTPVQTDSSYDVAYKSVYDSVNSSIVLAGSGRLKTTTYPTHYYTTPHYQTQALSGASSRITPYGWSLSGVLR